MLTDINPKLPMRHKDITLDFYINKLDFQEFGSADFDGYLIVQKDSIQIHFFEFKEIDPKENYGQVYIRTDNIEKLYQSMLNKKLSIHPSVNLEIKPWGQKEFSMLVLIIIYSLSARACYNVCINIHEKVCCRIVLNHFLNSGNIRFRNKF